MKKKIIIQFVQVPKIKKDHMSIGYKINKLQLKTCLELLFKLSNKWSFNNLAPKINLIN